MGRIWICLAFVIFAFGITHAQFYDYWDTNGDYDWYVSSSSSSQEIDAQDPFDKKDDNIIVDKVDDTVKDDVDNAEEKDEFNPLDDYQFEDNRSELKEELSVLEADIAKAGGFADSEGSYESSEESNEEDDQFDGPEVPDNESVIEGNPLEETQAILNEDIKEDNDFTDIDKYIKYAINAEDIEKLEDPDNADNDSDKEDDFKKIFDETRAILKENQDDKDFKKISESFSNEQVDSTFDKNISADDSNTLDDSSDDSNDKSDKSKNEDIDTILDETQTILQADDKEGETNDFAEVLSEKGDEQDTNNREQLLNEENSILFNEIQAILTDPVEVDSAHVNGDDIDMNDILDETERLLKEFESIEENGSRDVESVIKDLVTENPKPENNDDNDFSNPIDEILNKDQDITNGDEEHGNNEQKLKEKSKILSKADEKYTDLDDDLKQLFETWDALTFDDTKENEDVLQYEEKFGKPFREDVILSQREDYENVDDDNLADIFANDDSTSEESDGKTDDNDNNDEFELMKPEKEQQKETPLFYSNDALIPDEENHKALETDFEDNADQEDKSLENAQVDPPLDNKIETSSVKTISADNLTPEQYQDLMRQFTQLHSKALDTLSEDFGDHIAPIHMQLSVDTPVIVESPNYPSPYPTNNVIDWIFDGEGKGIELNITDLNINGLFEDYLLVKPGGTDDPGHNGILFSYHLNQELRFRFHDVDRLFVRFVANPGPVFFRGFQFSVRLIAPVPEDTEDPDAEALLPAPPGTLLVSLGGVTPEQFEDIREEFRQLVADMATVFINANDIDMGLNTTSETTQVLNATVCNVNWPNFQNCTSVRFGVPLVFVDGQVTRLNETDLQTMWDTYIYLDPFAFRLRRLGITEFEIPNDGRALMVWLLIAVGVVISAVLLSFALWRFSCFEDYTRMAAYSDTDSLSNDKRGLDLYPTPHQTLPPLYTENEYKWEDGKYEDSARGDMGGFTNKSYARDSMYDIESDEEIVVTPSTRDRYTSDV